MIIINEIKIRNFKNILTADLALNGYNLVVGANNSGKSNFMQIFRFLDIIFNSPTDDVKEAFEVGLFYPLGWIKPNQIDAVTKTEIGLQFSNRDTGQIYDYYISIFWEYLNKGISSATINKESFRFKSSSRPGRYIKVFERTGNLVQFGERYGNTKIIEEVQSYLSVMRLFSMLSESKNPYKTELDLLNIIVKTPVYYFSPNELKKSQMKNMLDKFGRTIAFDYTDDISKIIAGGKIDIFRAILFAVLKIEDVKIFESRQNLPHEKTKEVYFIQFNNLKSRRDLSDGSLLLISLITKILSEDNSVLLIEEPENSLHPKALIELNKFMNSYLGEKQFIIATHSLTLLNTTNPKDVIIANINEKGESTLENVSEKKDILKKLKNGFMDFSDFVFFPENTENEFE